MRPLPSLARLSALALTVGVGACAHRPPPPRTSYDPSEIRALPHPTLERLASFWNGRRLGWMTIERSFEQREGAERVTYRYTTEAEAQPGIPVHAYEKTFDLATGRLIHFSGEGRDQNLPWSLEGTATPPEAPTEYLVETRRGTVTTTTRVPFSEETPEQEEGARIAAFRKRVVTRRSLSVQPELEWMSALIEPVPSEGETFKARDTLHGEVLYTFAKDGRTLEMSWDGISLRPEP